MAALKGNEMLLKLGDGGDPTETFTTVAGIRAKTLEVNNNPVDVTTDDDIQSGTTFQNFITGVTSVSVSGNGIATSKADFNDLMAKALAGTAHNFQIETPYGTFEGPFRVGGLTVSASYDDTVAFDISLASSGEPSYTAAP